MATPLRHWPVLLAALTLALAAAGSLTIVERYVDDARRADWAAGLGFAWTMVSAAIVAALLLRQAARARREGEERLQAALDSQAFHDPLSGLPNRACFMDRLERALQRADRQGNRVAVLFLDLDNFKVVNDSLGQETGDRLLVAVAERLRASPRPEDTVARLGGDEFTVLLEEVADGRPAIRAAERILQQVRLPYALDKDEVFTTASIGIAISAPGRDQPEGLLHSAALAMYQAKANGKARFEVFDLSMRARALERMALETDLRHAVDGGGFTLCYQPIVTLESGRIGEVEALLRWEHPRRGSVSPAEFIPLAEETGLILSIGRWVLEEACRQARAWQRQYPSHPPLVVGVNLSARQFWRGCADDVARALHTTGLEPSSLKLEITESAMMRDVESTIRTLRRLSDLGVRVAIDDFGTGYSSLAYLKRFPLDTLKIDRSFVEKLGNDPADGAIVRTIITLAKTLNLVVTAEGIETPEQLTHLRALGCDRGQGYYFARPLPSKAMGELLARRERPSPGIVAPDRLPIPLGSSRGR